MPEKASGHDDPAPHRGRPHELAREQHEEDHREDEGHPVQGALRARQVERRDVRIRDCEERKLPDVLVVRRARVEEEQEEEAVGRPRSSSRVR